MIMNTRLFRRRLRHRQRDAEGGVGAEPPLVLRAVQLDHEPVHVDLVARLEPDDLRADDVVDVVDGLVHALAEVALLPGVPQLESLTLSS
jgi:hypothetical protein